MTEHAGTVLGGRYRLGEPIGRGGMGTVWRATDMVLDRQVAIKILVMHHRDDPDRSARFRREARILARLSHPRLGGVHDYGEEDGRAYTVMEFLTGETLQHRLSVHGQVPPAQAAEIAAEVAEGLHAAHQAGVIHRDIKPANIILTEQGVKVVDFGIALGAGDDRLTATGTLVGSATYLAPERATGRPATPASDVYSLGVVLYQMLAGRPPFIAPDAVELVSAHSRDPVPPLPAEIQGSLAGWCLRAMAKDPADRPAPALYFAAMLRQSTSRGRHAAASAPALASAAPPTAAAAAPATAPAAAPPAARAAAPVAAAAPVVPPAQHVHGTGLATGAPPQAATWRTAQGESARIGQDRQGPPTAHGEPAMDGPPTATLPSVQDWGETRPGARRWWVIWAAALATVIMVPLVTILAVAAARSGHTTARAHTTAHASTARPTTQINPEHQMPAVTWVIAAGPQQGQPPPPPSLLASAGTTVRLAEALHNGTQQPIAGATLSLSAPAGWTATPEEPATSGIIPAGGTATVIWSIAVPAAAQPGVFKLLATASCPAAAQCPTAPLTGSAVVPYASFSQAFDNVGIAPQSNSAAANLDGTGQSYSAEALAAAGYLPGAAVSHDGISFAWPDAQPGAPDNVAAQGQTFLLSATGAHLAFLGASDFGSGGGDGAIYYQDGSQQSFHLVMDDWWSNAAQPGQDEVAVSVPSFNGPPGQPPPSGRPVAVYFASIPLQAGKTVEAITLPAGSAPANGVPSLHLFAVAVG